MYVSTVRLVHLFLLLAIALPGFWPGCSAPKPEVFTPLPEAAEEERPAPRRRPARAFLGDTESRLFHRLECPRVQELPVDRKLLFDSPYKALNASYSPCEECLPLAGIR
ncbi:MAG: hypothetical protein ACYTDY_01750 [Planctomycetota bacterium]|jgi:hypothetical protein